MRYTDSHGRAQRLTPEQAHYLHTARIRGGFDCGWGGLSSTRTVRLLEERGLITLRDNRTSWPRWRVTGLNILGETVLDAWQTRQG